MGTAVTGLGIPTPPYSDYILVMEFTLNERCIKSRSVWRV